MGFKYIPVLRYTWEYFPYHTSISNFIVEHSVHAAFRYFDIRRAIVCIMHFELFYCSRVHTGWGKARMQIQSCDRDFILARISFLYFACYNISPKLQCSVLRWAMRSCIEDMELHRLCCASLRRALRDIRLSRDSESFWDNWSIFSSGCSLCTISCLCFVVSLSNVDCNFTT